MDRMVRQSFSAFRLFANSAEEAQRVIGEAAAERLEKDMKRSGEIPLERICITAAYDVDSKMFQVTAIAPTIYVGKKKCREPGVVQQVQGAWRQGLGMLKRIPV